MGDFMVTYLKIICIGFCLMLSVSNCFALDFSFNFKNGATRSDNATIQSMVEDALKLKDNTVRAEFYHCNIDVHADYFFVALYVKGVYSVELYRLGFNGNTITSLSQNEADFESDPALLEPCAACPDTSVQFLLSNFVDRQFPLCDGKTTEVANALTKAGYKVKQLRDNEENLAAIKSWLSCPRLIMWGRIGHGGDNGGSIILGANNNPNSYIYTKDIAGIKNLIAGKYFPFNSCYIGGTRNPTTKTMVDNGALFGCGGNDVMLMAGTSEPVWANFVKAIVLEKKEVKSQADGILKKAPKDKFAYHMKATELYVFPTTSITNKTEFVSKRLCTVVQYTNSTIDLVFPGSPQGTNIAIYNMIGQKYYSDIIKGNHFSWNWNRDAAQSGGKFIIVVNNNLDFVEKRMITLVK